jgi:hypothetical protein
VTKRPHFAEQAAGHHKCPKIMQQNVHISLTTGWTLQTCQKNPVTKRPHFPEHAAGHHKCTKIMRQNIHISQKSRLDIVNMLGKIL